MYAQKTGAKKDLFRIQVISMNLFARGDLLTSQMGDKFNLESIRND